MLKSLLIILQKRIIPTYHSPNGSFRWLEKGTGCRFCNVNGIVPILITANYSNISDSSVSDVFLGYCEDIAFIIKIGYMFWTSFWGNRVWAILWHWGYCRNRWQICWWLFWWDWFTFCLRLWLVCSQQIFWFWIREWGNLYLLEVCRSLASVKSLRKCFYVFCECRSWTQSLLIKNNKVKMMMVSLNIWQ